MMNSVVFSKLTFLNKKNEKTEKGETGKKKEIIVRNGLRNNDLASQTASSKMTNIGTKKKCIKTGGKTVYENANVHKFMKL